MDHSTSSVRSTPSPARPPATTAPTTKSLDRDWTQYLYPGPNRVFSAEEMAAVGQDAFPKAIERYAAINLTVAFLAVVAMAMPSGRGLYAAVAMALFGGTFLLSARQIWRQPTRQRANLWIAAFGVATGVMFALGERALRVQGFVDKSTAIVMVTFLVFLVSAVSALWFLAIYRVQQLETRLSERAARIEQDRLQRRLATAQIHPHFVFNTLASLQHWVETQDARAAPLLHDFNAYLRATLPMFERESQSLREELALVRHFLSIMEARLGGRLVWSVEADPATHDALVPPGSVLTLVENAITHGIEPALRGGEVHIRCTRDAGLLRVVVEDRGEGLSAPVHEGLGLTNTRARLLALHPQARLHLQPLPAGGCLATVEVPA